VIRPRAQGWRTLREATDESGIIAAVKDAQRSIDLVAATPAKFDVDEGVDVTLIRWCLSLTPQGRLEAIQANVNAIVRLRDAVPTTP
jgi:hypothetical protein